MKPSQLSGRGGHSAVDIEALNADDLDYHYTVQGLAALRRRLVRAISRYSGAWAGYQSVMAQALELEAVIKARQARQYTGSGSTVVTAASASFPGGGNGGGSGSRALAQAVFAYKCLVAPPLYKLLSLGLAALSCAILWSEATLMLPKDLSPFSTWLRADHHGEFSTQAGVLIPLAYLCAATYFGLFSMSAFDFNKLQRRATQGDALMQNGSLLCRFAPPVCWNFYHILHMSSDLPGGDITVFAQKMGKMYSLPLLVSLHLHPLSY